MRILRRLRIPIRQPASVAAGLAFATLPVFATGAGLSGPRGAVDGRVAPAAPAASTTSQATATPVSNLCRRPPDAPMLAAYARSNRAELCTTVRLWLQYTDDGTVVSMWLDPGSRDRTLDAAVLEWAKGLALCPGPAGSGYLGLTFDGDP